MPLYDYYCPKCTQGFTEFRKIEIFAATLKCPFCEEGTAHIDISKVNVVMRIGNKPGRVKDAFQPGFNPALGQSFQHPDEYKRAIKEAGLVEVGNEKGSDRKVDDTTERRSKALDAKRMGAELSDRQVDALASGEKLHND